MEQFDNWQQYWDNYLLNKYGKQEVVSDADLYFQVARILYKKPIDKAVFDRIVDEITHGLFLQDTDVLVDFCCGNGLFTYELKNKVNRIIGVDFSAQIIDTANQFKNADNITYCLGDGIEFLRTFKAKFPGVKPTKYINNDSLAYFSQHQLEEILGLVQDISGSNFHFLLRGVPDAGMMWNYYNTEERKQKYLTDKANGDFSNDGLGRWWLRAEIETACNKFGLRHIIKEQDIALSNYRMDIMIQG